MSDKAEGLYIITDNVAEKDSPVMQEPNDRTARRRFAELMKGVQFPSDFSLRRVGWIENGVLIPDVEISLQDTIETEV